MRMRRGLAALLAAFLLWAGAAQAQMPVDQRVVREAVAKILGDWNTLELKQWLSSEFPGRDRLLAALDFDVPPTARLRILSIGSVQTLEQERIDRGLASLVAVSVRAQAEWEDPEHGFQRRTGTSEYILRIVQRVPR